MKIWKYIRPTNRRVRVLVGLLLAGLFLIQFTPAEAFRDADTTKISIENPDDVLEELAENNHIAILEKCLTASQKLTDYTCTFIKTERINGAVKGEQWMDVKFLAEPYSVALKWKSYDDDGKKLFIPMADTIIYVEGKYNNEMLARPTSGFLRKLCPVAKRKPDGPEAMRSTLRPVNLFGFERGTQSLLDVYHQAELEGDLEQKFGGYAEVNGRETIVLVRYLPMKNEYPAWETKTYIDLEWMLPIMIEGKEWDGTNQCRYIYKDVNFAPGLTETDFLPENNGMKKQ